MRTAKENSRTLIRTIHWQLLSGGNYSLAATEQWELVDGSYGEVETSRWQLRRGGN